MIRRLVAPIAVLLICAICSCDGGPSADGDGAISPRVSSGDSQETFTIGRIPFTTPSTMVAAHRPVLDLLAVNLGVSRVTMVTAPNYSGVLRLLDAGTIDAAWLGTTAYVRARLRGSQIVPLVCPVREGTHFYRGEIIARSDSGIGDLASLKGRTIAFVEPSSASGYLFPRALLAAAGVRVPGDVLTREHGEADFLGKHDTVVTAVYMGSFDAGAVYEGALWQTLGGESNRMAEMQVVARTDKIFNEPIVVRADLPVDRQEEIRKAFLGIMVDEEEQTPETGGLSSFAPVSAEDYDAVEEALRTIVRRYRTLPVSSAVVTEAPPADDDPFACIGFEAEEVPASCAPESSPCAGCPELRGGLSR